MAKRDFRIRFVTQTHAEACAGFLALWVKSGEKLSLLSVKHCDDVKKEIESYNKAQPLWEHANNSIVFACLDGAVVEPWERKEDVIKELHKQLSSQKITYK